MAFILSDCFGIRISHRASNIIRWIAAGLFGTLTLCLVFLNRYFGAISLALFIYFILAFVFRGSSAPLPLSARLVVALVILLSTSVITALPWVVFGGKEACQASRGTYKTPSGQGFEDHWLEVTLRLVFVWVLALQASFVNLGDHPPSAHVRQSIRCITFGWFGKLLNIVTPIVDSCQVPQWTEEGFRPTDAEEVYFTVFGMATHYITDVWFLQLVVDRLVAFQAAYGEKLPCSFVIVWLSRVMIFMAAMQLFSVVSPVVSLTVAMVLTMGVCTLSILHCGAYMVPYNDLLQAHKVEIATCNALSVEMEKESTFAMLVIRKSQIGFLVGCIGMVAAFLTNGLDWFILPRAKTLWMIYVVASNVGSSAITFSFVVLSGVNFKWCNCRSKLQQRPAETGGTSMTRGDLRHYSQKSWSFDATTSRKEVRASDWQKKVADLAMRRISVETLLRFFLQLGSDDAMPHFDPKRSTTNDVVRHVVIPHSRDGSLGRSFAEKFGPQKALTPKMVTHHWSNRFCDLVAAVLADALGLKRWDGVAEHLRSPGGGERLQEQLYANGTLQSQYWICAFCINQHASICGSSMGVLDTVTQTVLPSCDCATMKYLNDQPVQCELNKFDDMMAYLHRQYPKFLQVVAIDFDFMIFSRAWCLVSYSGGNISTFSRVLKNTIIRNRNLNLLINPKP